MKTQPDMYQPIRRTAISEDVVANILQLIQEKKLNPGDKLPSERELSELLQVSRPSLREGMRTLAYMNIIDIRTGDGAYVTSLSPELLVAHLDFVFSIDDSTIFQLLEARKFIEPELAAAAAERATPDDLERLNTQWQKMETYAGELEDLTQMDVDLHMLIAHAAHNPILSRFVASLRSLAKRSRERTIQIASVREQARKDHAAIVAAINAHDADAARQAMKVHLENIEQGLKGEQVPTS